MTNPRAGDNPGPSREPEGMTMTRIRNKLQVVCAVVVSVAAVVSALAGAGLVVCIGMAACTLVCWQMCD